MSLRWRYPDKPNRTFSLRHIREGDFMAQVKRDGWNAVIIKDNDKISVLSRNRNPLDVSPFMLEALNNLKLDNGDVINAEWTGRRKADRIEFMYLFCWMYRRYEWLGTKSEEYRHKMLFDLKPQEGIAVIGSTDRDYAQLYKRVIDDWTTEGIVLKAKNAKLIGDPNSSKKNPLMMKLKWRDGPGGDELCIVPDEDLVCKT